MKASWTRAMLTPDGSGVTVFDPAEKESTLFDMATGEVLAESGQILPGLTSQWRRLLNHLSVDEQKSGAVSLGGFFVLTDWVEFKEPVGYLETPAGTASLKGIVRHAFSLSRFDPGGNPTHSIIGWIDESGHSLAIDLMDGLSRAIGWSPLGSYLWYLIDSQDGNVLCVADAARAIRTMSLSGVQVLKALSPDLQDEHVIGTICPSVGWSVDERILSLVVQTGPEGSDAETLLCRVGVTGQNLTLHLPADEDAVYREHRAAFEKYWECINNRDESLIDSIPEYVRLFYGGDLYLRQNAIDYFTDTQGEAIDCGGFHLVSPRPHSAIGNPVTIKLWHSTNHYAGGILLIVDEEDNMLCKYRLPEVASINEVLRPLTVEIPYLEPKTESGFIIGLKWDAKYGEQRLEEGHRIPVHFGNVSPGLLNQVLDPRDDDVSFVGLPVEDAKPELVWQLFLPWSREGLGRGEKYLGLREGGGPIDVEPPARLVVGPGDIIAVQDGWGDRTRLYDREGQFLDQREGFPLGFTLDGGLITFGDMVRRYSPSGDVLWERDPHAVAKKMLGLPESSPTELVGGYSTAFASPWGDVYCSVRIGRYTAGTCLSPDEPGVELPQWIQTDEFHVGVIYDADGKLVRFVSEGIPGGLCFTPRVTAFGTAVPVENAYAHREFEVRDGKFTLRRTLRLENYAIQAVGKDGSVVAKSPGIPTPFTVYREGSRRAVRFVLPGKHMAAYWDFEGHVYSMEYREDGLVIACWKWPVPE